MENKEELELEVRRILASEVEGHRSFLQSQFRNLTWGIGILFTVGAIIFSFLFGRSIDESREHLISTIDTKVVDYRIVESFKKKLEEFISIAVERAIDEEKTKEKIAVYIAAATKKAVEQAKKEAEDSLKESIEDTLTKTVKEEISQTKILNASQLIEKTSMPRGAVISFNREACPHGWEEYEAAYGRFIRGTDKSGKKIDPDGKRKSGSLQNDSFASHNHEHYIIGWGKGKSDPSHARADGNSPRNRWSYRTKNSGRSETRPKNITLLYCKKT